jgi:nitrite reductase (NO-forming)
VALGGVGAALGFLALSAGSLALPADARLGLWLPVHLALAGAAGTAIAAMLPFFVGALSVGSPAPAAVRVGSLVLVALGTVLGVAGRVGSGGAPSPVAALGAASYVIGMALVGIAAALPLRRATGTRRAVTEIAYAVGLANVLVGVSIVALHLAGDPGTAAAWAGLRVAHAWLNLLGFVALVIAGTLVHFAPTVAGSRIRRRRSGAIAVGLLALAAPVVATGYAMGSSAVATVGAAAAVAGAGALAVHGWHADRGRAGWTSDQAWHRFTSGSLLVAPVWLLVATLVALAGIVLHGTGPASWRLELVAGPLVLGFVIQVLLGSVSHLVPAIGRGTPVAHAAQRRVLGREATLRLTGWNVGVALFSAGQLVGSGVVVAAGGALLLVSGLATLGVVAGSFRG